MWDCFFITLRQYINDSFLKVVLQKICTICRGRFRKTYRMTAITFKVDMD